MADIEKLQIIIDRDACIGDGACVDAATETFEIDDEAKAIVREGSTDSREYILEAAERCPVDCIVVKCKDSGEQLYPTP
ncbi:MAG: ferredoxin [Phycisphaerae bacterium]|nr:ferredoxin [Phycisphaerae bacterium]